MRGDAEADEAEALSVCRAIRQGPPPEEYVPRLRARAEVVAVLGGLLERDAVGRAAGSA